MIIEFFLIFCDLMQPEYNQIVDPAHKLEVQNFDKHHVHQACFRKFHSQILTLKYDDSDDLIALGSRDGSIMLFSHSQHKVIDKFQGINDNAITSIKWRPPGTSNSKILVSTDAEGHLIYWHTSTGKRLFTLTQKDNAILCMDFSRNGSTFATAGRDFNIRIYDEQTKSLTQTLRKAEWNHVGHDNRVFSTKFVDENILISGGWDTVVHIWDVREGKSIRHFYGPHVSGESIDFQDGRILIGCYAAQNQLQVWDFNKCHKIQEIDWTGNIENAAYIYTAGYSKHNLGLIGAGSTGVAEVRLYEEKEEGKHKLVSQIKGVNEAVFSFDFCHHKKQFAFSTAHHGFYVYDYNKK